MQLFGAGEGIALWYRCRPHCKNAEVPSEGRCTGRAIDAEDEWSCFRVAKESGAGRLLVGDVGDVHRVDLAGADYFEPAGRY
jgi:hypothetical protein